MTDKDHEPGRNAEHSDSVASWLDDSRRHSFRSSETHDDTMKSSDLDSLSDSEAQQLLTHVMLAECFESHARRELRIEKTIQSFGSASKVETSTDAVSPTAIDDRKTLRQTTKLRPSAIRKKWYAQWWSVAIATAASVALVAAIGFSLSASKASAAMNRVIESCRAPTTRVYDISIQSTGILSREKRLDGTLHTRSVDRFVAEFPDTPQGPTVLGFDGEKRWWLQGDERWNSDSEIQTRRDAVINLLTGLQLQINSFLVELPERYEIRLLEAEPLPGEPTVMCRPIEAKRTGFDRRLATTVRIWAHPETGVVVQLELVRERFKHIRASRVRLTLREEVNVPDSVFTAKYHELRALE